MGQGASASLLFSAAKIKRNNVKKNDKLIRAENDKNSNKWRTLIALMKRYRVIIRVRNKTIMEIQ